jgi:hypothetical protein
MADTVSGIRTHDTLRYSDLATRRPSALKGRDSEEWRDSYVFGATDNAEFAPQATVEPAQNREHLYQRGGRWYVRVQIEGHDYRRSLETDSREEAEERLAGALHEIKDEAQPLDYECEPTEAAANVNRKGDLGTAKTVADLVAQGYDVYLPFSGSCPVDVVAADRAQRLRRLQVKYRAADDRGYIAVRLCTIINGKIVPIDLSKIDGWAVYCPDTDHVYYVPKALVRKRQFCICVGAIAPQRAVLLGGNLRSARAVWVTPRAPGIKSSNQN